MNSLLWIAHLSSFSALAPFALALTKWKWIDKKSKLIFCLVTMSLLADGVSFGMMNNGINTWPIGNAFLIIQFCIFFLILDDNDIRWRYLFALCLLCFVFNFFFLQSPKIFNSYTSYVSAILLIFIALKYLYTLISDVQSHGVQRIPTFWISFGVLQYYGGTLLLFLFTNYLIEFQRQNHQIIWTLHNGLNILKNSLLLIAVWINYRSQISFR